MNIKADNFTLLRHGNYFVTPVQLALGVQVFLYNVSLATSQGRTAGTTAQCTLSQAIAWSTFAILSLHEREDINDSSYLMDTIISGGGGGRPRSLRGHVVALEGKIFNNCMLCPRCIYVFCIYLRTNSDL